MALYVRTFLLIFAAVFLLNSCSLVRHGRYPELPRGKEYATASWYGPNFHGKPTSSGEIFDMYKYTCAHKIYPFGLKVKVTNVANRRSVECIVNDRGPFIEGRDLDLSYAAAREIGLLGPGVGPVILESSGRDTRYVKDVRIQVSKREGPFAIQIGAFTENINAVRLKTALTLEYSNVYIIEAWVEGQKFYRVRIGDFGDFENAFSIAERLGQVGYPTFIVRSAF